jgi:uncharacterized protein with GYD domain
MPLYATLWKYTRDGMVDIKKTSQRYKQVQKIIKDSGGKLVSIYGLVGEYDVLTIMDMPDEKVLASTVLKICSKGRIGSQSMTAIPIDDFLKITQGV